MSSSLALTLRLSGFRAFGLADQGDIRHFQTARSQRTGFWVEMTKASQWSEPIVIPKRKKMSKSQRAKFFELHKGICHFCEGVIEPGQRWEASHLKDLEISGDDSDENKRPAHYKCHRVYTYGPGIKGITKARRLSNKHTGQTQPKGTIQSQGFRNDGPKRAWPSRPFQKRAKT